MTAPIHNTYEFAFHIDLPWTVHWVLIALAMCLCMKAVNLLLDD